MTTAILTTDERVPRSSFGRGLSRWRGLVNVALAMLFHDRMKLIGALAGVVFATVLTTEQISILYGIVTKNSMLLERVPADIWIVPVGSKMIEARTKLPAYMRHRARAVPGVQSASPLLMVGATVTLPQGGTEAVNVLGIDPETFRDGKWNLVAGSQENLLAPDAMFFEDTERENLGGLNLGSVREVSGRRVQVVGFTWGMTPLGPSYAIASFDLARELSHQTDESQSMILVNVKPGVDLETVATDLQKALPDATVYTRDSFRQTMIGFMFTKTPVGYTFGGAALFALLVGLVIVAISMFSAVIDHMREFGTLKAIGATSRDLAIVLLVQAFIYGLFGSGIGLIIVSAITNAIHTPMMALVLPAAVALVMPVLMIAICLVASILPLRRLRKLEPAMVFKG